MRRAISWSGTRMAHPKEWPPPGREMAQLLVPSPSSHLRPHSARLQRCPPTRPQTRPRRSHQVCRASSLHVRPQRALFQGSLRLTRARRDPTAASPASAQAVVRQARRCASRGRRDAREPRGVALRPHLPKMFHAQRAREGGHVGGCAYVSIHASIFSSR